MTTKRSEISVFWFRRDLRLEDNRGLHQALQGGRPVLPLFIFDQAILEALPDRRDRRVEFIHRCLAEIQQTLQGAGSSLLVRQGDTQIIWQDLLDQYDIKAVYTNHDYEPYAGERDQQVRKLLQGRQIPFHTFKDQVIFEKDEVLTAQGNPYTVYTPYRNRWRALLKTDDLRSCPSEDLMAHFWKTAPIDMPALEALGFQPAGIAFPPKTLRREIVEPYHEQRDYPGIDGTTRLGVHLRFGTVSIRDLVRRALDLNETWLDELVWREFFMMILWHFPYVVDQPFKEKYAAVPWRESEADFQRWCEGQTGYPMVDAGMRELNATGFMHNRVRMLTASFLTKHLLIDWRKGERYFAEKLLDYELASNNGNWQWSAGCGCDAAPYFRIFNPTTQIQKFDPDHTYIKQWVPELNSLDYPNPMVEHKFARERALKAFKSALG